MAQGIAVQALRRFDSPQQEAFLGLWRTYDCLKAIEDELFARHELTAQQYNALRLLRAAHPETLPTLRLAARLVSRAPDVTRMLSRLEDRRLIERERPRDDRRTVRVGITDEGRKLVKDLARDVRACHQRQMGHLTADETQALITLLRKVRQPHEEAHSDWR